MSPFRTSDVLSVRQIAFLADHLPEPPRARTGRAAYPNRALLPGIPRVLRSGCRWRALDRSGFPSGSDSLAPPALLASE
jgi:transposase